MGEKMTDKEFHAQRDTVERLYGWRGLANFMETEAARARAAEAEKDATVKALADALEAGEVAIEQLLIGLRAGAPVAQKAIKDALRLVGRIP